MRQLGSGAVDSNGADVSAGPGGLGTPASPTKEQVQAIVDALVRAGVSKGAILTTFMPDGPFYGTFGQGVAVLVFQLDADHLKKIGKLVQLALKAGDGAGISFDAVNAVYTTADCASVSSAALSAAVADAGAQANAMASALGRTLGDLVQAVSQSTYGHSYAGAGGGQNFCSQGWTLESATTSYLSSFDPNAAPEVEISANISLTFALK